jgi:ABC-2 type transport system permease protein
MYPGGIFQGFARFLIFFVIPAGFMVHLPVEILRVFSWAGMLEAVVAAVVIWALAILVFRAGLRRYESGNQVTLRG